MGFEMTATTNTTLATRLKKEIRGDVLFDAASRGRYSTDASIYQIEPVGVVIPQTEEDATLALQIALDAGVAVLPRGGGTSQCGQTVGDALIIDVSKHLRHVLDFNAEARTAVVQPGVVLDQLNASLKPHGLWYPVDVSTSAQATIGGMAGNNSCGSRSIFYGNMVHNVRGVDAVLADGGDYHFGAVPSDLSQLDGAQGYHTCSWVPRARSPTRSASISICRRCLNTRRWACAISRRSTNRWKRRCTL
jgi:FAD/FMN-containing dehydrogenase